MANQGTVPSAYITAQDRLPRFGVLVVVACMALSATGCASMGSVQSASTDKSQSEVSKESSAEESRDWLVDSAPEAVYQAAEALAQGDLERALYFYIAALDLGDESADTYYKIGLIHKHLGDLVPAVLAFEKAVTKDSEKAEAWEALGLIMLSNQQKDRASECLVKATNLDPDRWRAYNGLGIIADLDGYRHMALINYNIALDIQSGSPAVFNNRGYSHYMAGDFDAAQRDFAMALHLDSEFSLGWRNLALVEVRRENYEQALRNLGRIMNAAAAHNDIGYISMMAGKHDVAEIFFRESIRLSPSYDTMTHENFDLNRELRQFNIK